MLLRAAALMLAMAVPVSAPAAEPSFQARIVGEMHRLDSLLDPVSAEVLRANQTSWEAWVHGLEERAAAMVKGGQVGPQDLAEIKASVRQQRLGFLAGIKPAAPDAIRGGWGDGMKEVLFDMDGHGRAKLASIAQDIGGKNVLCVVKGVVKTEGDGFVITPDNLPGYPIHVRRLGIALSIESDAKQPAGPAPYCQPGGTLAGQFFRIEGAEKVMPWLLY